MANKLGPTDKNLVVSFLHFLRQKMSTGQVNEEQSESLEVGIQCIEQAFSLTDKDKAFHPSRPLEEIFAHAEPATATPNERMPEPSAGEKGEAEKLKNEGNELMKQERYQPAVEKYTEAIRIHRNPVFFCNRAAAYSKMEKYDMSIQDCKTAISLDPNYGKAYGRMGLAMSCQNRYREAADAYKRAVELDPDNESFRNNLDIAEQKATENPPPQVDPFGGMLGGMGGMNIGNMLNNPAMMEMASQMMSDPQMQNLMGSLMGGANQEGAGGFEAMMRAGQQLASQMQSQNPDLVDQLRRQMGGGGGGGGGNQDGGDGGGGTNPPGSGGGGSNNP